ncbi:hypothetical protein GPECTOR_59g619 [Gonium pectorale]|uniref:Uncharacterized protein n=1 Tax=Gonium pectorale TaxID=33097 RepID=A0A150G586_GONPE|nr:hypothetical protein GPECTOR_59g619 [Gonium pectorale]|eukprot:KXZ45012.1 hypothetical protein GPECTOR_59g619 [Gonium pectorale]
MAEAPLSVAVAPSALELNQPPPADADVTPMEPAAAAAVLPSPAQGPLPPSASHACSVARLRRSPAPFVAHASGRLSLALCGMGAHNGGGPAPPGA